jgi:maltooligosyltrehalose trehalohydrolase
MPSHHVHTLPFGATLDAGGTCRFRLWAPSAASVSLEIEGRPPIPMTDEGGGWKSAEAPAQAGTRYRFVLPDGLAVPDPASCLQSGDVHGWSVVVDPAAFPWRNTSWRGRPWNETVVYELHPGACGGFAGIAERLEELHELGVTAIELMPIADFPGRHNWGYDGVLPYAPDEAYGTPEALKALIDAAHGRGMMVFLDVVYNHFGPDGNYLHAYAEPFFRNDIQTPWGASIDFRRPEVRDYFIQNALYWLQEYRFDGLRFDAVHQISEPDFLDEMARAIRAATGADRHVHLVLEHEGNRAAHLAPGLFDAQWTDDWHHCMHVMLTGEHEGYYEDFQDAARLLARCMAEGFAYQGEVSPHSGHPRGEPSGHLPPTAFVICLQNHDQIGNRAFGERLTKLADPEALRAATVVLLLSPFVPMLFMGEEWATEAPFLFFTDHNEELAKLVREGRRREFKKFAAFTDPARRETIPDPNAHSTFDASVPDPAEAARDPHATVRALHRDLLAIRARYIAPRIPGARSEGASVIGPRAVRASWRMGDGSRLSVAINLDDAPVPMETPPGELLYGTGDHAAIIAGEGALPGRAAMVFLAEAAS